MKKKWIVSIYPLGMSTKEIEKLLHDRSLDKKVVVAGKNDRNNITLSGDSDAVAEVEQYLKRERPEIFCRVLEVNKAFHSHHLDIIKEDFFTQVDRIKLGQVKNKTPVCSLFSTVKGARVSSKEMTTTYFWENMRNPVLSIDAMEGMLADGIRVLIEISPVPILLRYLGNIVKSTSLGTEEDPVHIVSSFPRLQESDVISHLYVQCIGRMYTLGYPVCWDRLFDYSECSFIQYPSYAWQEARHWCFEVDSGTDNATHLLGKVKTNTSSNGILWTNDIDCFTFDYLSGHQLYKMGCIFPGAGYVEMAMEAVIGGPYLEPIVIKNVSFDNILTLPSDTLRRLETSMLLDKTKTKDRIEIFHLGQDGKKILLAQASVEKRGCNVQRERKSLIIHGKFNKDFYQIKQNDLIPNLTPESRL